MRERGADIPDDFVWRFRHLDWEALAERIGVSSRTVYRRLSPRGWKRDGGGNLLSAPCAECGTAHPVGELGLRRKCAGCRNLTRHPLVLEEMRKRGLVA